MDTVTITHPCGHGITTPRAYMPPALQAREGKRPCPHCRRQRRHVCRALNEMQGLLPLKNGTELQRERGEEIRYNWTQNGRPDPLPGHTSLDANFDALWWIANHASLAEPEEEPMKKTDIAHRSEPQRLESRDETFSRGAAQIVHPSETWCWKCGLVAKKKDAAKAGWDIGGKLCAEHRAPAKPAQIAADIDREAELAHLEGPEPTPIEIQIAAARLTLDDDHEPDALDISHEINPAPAAEEKAPSHFPPQLADPRYVLSAQTSEVPPSAIAPSPLNPRRTWDDSTLQELAASIREHGIIQPLTVRRQGGVGQPFSLLDGERRLRAAAIAGLREVPIRIMEAESDAEALALMLVANLQRDDLSAIEEARAYGRLVDLDWKQEQIGLAVGKKQSTVSNALRLLRLPESVQDLVTKGELEASTARAIVRFADFPAVAEKIAGLAVLENTSSRFLERARLPFPNELQQAKLVRTVAEWQAQFSLEEHCCQCPYKAYIPPDDNASYSHGYCLKPAHYTELQEAAEAKKAEEAREAALRSNAAAARAAARPSTTGAKGGAAGSASETGEPATGPPPPALPHLREMSSATYEDLRCGRKPPGCDSNCPCFGRALGFQGEEAPICTDPARFKKLTVAATRAANKAGKLAIAHLWARVGEMLCHDLECVTRALAYALDSAWWNDALSVRRAACEAVGVVYEDLHWERAGYSKAKDKVGERLASLVALGWTQLAELIAARALAQEHYLAAQNSNWHTPHTAWAIDYQDPQAVGDTETKQ